VVILIINVLLLMTVCVRSNGLSRVKVKENNDVTFRRNEATTGEIYTIHIYTNTELDWGNNL